MKPRVVLIVEDSEECAATIEIALGTMRDISVQVTSTAEDALSVLRGTPVAAMITDLHLPTMDGLELVASVRKDSRYATIPILVISGDADPRTPDKVRGAGADAFFPKPYSPVAVRQKLEELINAR